MIPDKQWKDTTKKVFESVLSQMETIPEAIWVLIAVNPDANDLVTASNRCPHLVAKMLEAARKRNAEALISHEANGDHSLN